MAEGNEVQIPRVKLGNQGLELVPCKKNFLLQAAAGVASFRRKPILCSKHENVMAKLLEVLLDWTNFREEE